MLGYFRIAAVFALTILPLRAGTVLVFAASSLTDSLTEIARNYSEKNGDKITLNFEASSTLARQILEGAPADIFFSADEAKMDLLEQAHRIRPQTRHDRLSNSLVIVVASDNSLGISSPRDLLQSGVKHIALGDPASVPAGIYASNYLSGIGLWTNLAPKIVPTENVRAALAAVESGNAEAAIVYATDAARSRRAKIAVAIPPSVGPPITYPVAQVANDPNPEAARKFLDFLASADADKVFQNYGFVVARSSAHDR